MDSRPGRAGQLVAVSTSLTTREPDSTTRPSSGRSPTNRSSGVWMRRSETSWSSVRVNRAP